MEAAGLPERLVDAAGVRAVEPDDRRPAAASRAASPATSASGSSATTRRTSDTPGPGQLTAKAAAERPDDAHGPVRVAGRRRSSSGKPLANEEEIGERLSKKKALAIFSSDAISSSAYATEEILLAFLLAGVGGAAFPYAIQVSIAIAVLLGIVAFSYRQVCIAYPTAAARTRCQGATSAGWRRWSPRRRCSSTTP